MGTEQLEALGELKAGLWGMADACERSLSEKGASARLIFLADHREEG